jgi:hypothetical protein
VSETKSRRKGDEVVLLLPTTTTQLEIAKMASAALSPTPRINPTRPEHLAASTKRQSKFQLLQLYQQLLPLQPAPPTFRNSLRTALGHSLDSLPIHAEWDPYSAAVWVRGERDMVRLWRQGFFGKGFLSRSEPAWKRRVENRRAELEGGTKRKSNPFPFVSTDEEGGGLLLGSTKGTRSKIEANAASVTCGRSGRGTLFLSGARENQPLSEQHPLFPPLS